MNQNHRLPILVFDFGGVFFDWSPHYLFDRVFGGDMAAVDRFLAEIGFTEWNAKQDLGRTFAEAVAEHSRIFPQYAKMIKAYDENWLESIGGVFQPTVDILAKLKQAGYRLYGFSNWSVEKFELIRSRHDFLSWFDDIVISGEVNLIKPDPRIFRVLLKRIRRKAKECLLIDDTQANLDTAARLGFKTILFQSPVQLEQQLNQHGVLF